MKKSWLLVLFFLLHVGLLEVHAETLVVDLSGGGEFSTIRKAINVAESGDEILVRPGYYREGEIPVRQPVTIVGVPGQVILEGGFVVEASGISISGFDMRGFGRGVGVELKSFGNTIEGCTIRNFSTGVLSASSNNLVLGSAIEGCSVGVRLLDGSDDAVIDTKIWAVLGADVAGSQGFSITNCTISGGSGVVIANSSGGTVKGSFFIAETGVEISNSDGIMIGGNNLSSPARGIVVQGSKNNDILDNAVSRARSGGIILVGSENCSAINNSAQECNLGIVLKDSFYNLIKNNLLEESQVAGLRLEGSKNNEIFGNLFIDNVGGLTLKSGSIENSIEGNHLLRNELGLSILGSGGNVLRGNRMDLNRRAVRVDRENLSASDDFPFRQDFDSSNSVDGRPVCYLVDGRDLLLSGDCGLLVLVGCENVTFENQILSNNSAGALIVNSTDCVARNVALYENDVGVRMLNAKGCKIEESRADNCTVGFLVQGGRDDDILSCIALGSSESGFEIEDSESSVLKGLVASEGGVGISLLNSSGCMILSSTVTGNEEEGMRLIRSSKCVLNQNRASENRRGISASGSEGATVIRNDLSSNQEAGIALDHLSMATVSGNAAIGNGDGIFLQSVSGAKIEGNNLSENSRYGLRMSHSRDGKVAGNSFVQNGLGGASLIDCTDCVVYHNNFIENGNSMLPQNAVDNGDNAWDAGPELGGNYWSDHAVEGNPGSSPKKVPAEGMDRYPFGDPDGWK
jgi:parallel beta-helix repeat protein